MSKVRCQAPVMSAWATRTAPFAGETEPATARSARSGPSSGPAMSGDRPRPCPKEPVPVAGRQWSAAAELLADAGDRNREVQAAAVHGLDARDEDPDDVTLGVDRGAAGVARVRRCVGLDRLRR